MLTRLRIYGGLDMSRYLIILILYPLAFPAWGGDLPRTRTP